MSVLVVAPHMDDEVLGCGGVLQVLGDSKVVFATEREDDTRYVDGRYVDYAGSQRIVEMLRASVLLGFEPVRLGYRVHDGADASSMVQKLERHLDGVELILAPGPSHDQDHVAVRWAVEAVCRPHRFAGSVLEYFTWGGPSPGDRAVVVPLSDLAMSRKLEALSCYESQLVPDGHEDRFYAYGRESVLAYARAAGRLVHAEFAEAFTPVRLVPNLTTARLFGG